MLLYAQGGMPLMLKIWKHSNDPRVPCKPQTKVDPTTIFMDIGTLLTFPGFHVSLVFTNFAPQLSKIVCSDLFIKISLFVLFCSSCLSFTVLCHTDNRSHCSSLITSHLNTSHVSQSHFCPGYVYDRTCSHFS